MITHPDFPAQDILDRRPGRAGRQGRADRALLHDAAHGQGAPGSTWFEAIRAVGPERTGPPATSARSTNPPVEDGLAADGRPAARRRASARSEVRTMAVDQHTPAGGRVMSRRVLAIGAHAADFVWRAGGRLALAAEAGGHRQRARAFLRRARRVGRALEGAQGQTVENVKRIRHARGARRAAAALGATSAASTSATTRCEVDGEAPRAGSPTRSASSRPTCSSPTPTATRSTPTTRSPSRRSSAPARWPRGAGVAERVRDDRAARALPLRAASARAVQLHPDDVRRHHAGDRAEGGDGRDEGRSSTCRPTTPSAPSSAANHARRVSGDTEIRQYAEAFQRVMPQVVTEL